MNCIRCGMIVPYRRRDFICDGCRKDGDPPRPCPCGRMTSNDCAGECGFNGFLQVAQPYGMPPKTPQHGDEDPPLYQAGAPKDGPLLSAEAERELLEDVFGPDGVHGG